MTKTNRSHWVGMARRINARWIVHQNLSHHAGLYLDHLEQTDESRLVASCRNACRMIERCDPMEDPKPWFYAGLFSLAKPGEAERFLAAHWLTSLVTAEAEATSVTTPPNVAEATQDKIRRLREAVVALPGPAA